jgi:hypothetical protein
VTPLLQLQEGEGGVPNNHLPCIEEMIHKKKNNNKGSNSHPPLPLSIEGMSNEEEDPSFVVCFSLTNSQKKKKIQ